MCSLAGERPCSDASAQDVVELVRDTPGESPDRFEPLRSVEPRLEFLPFGFVGLASHRIREDVGGGPQLGDVVFVPLRLLAGTEGEIAEVLSGAPHRNTQPRTNVV